MRAAFLTLLLALGAAACTSPESTRTRAGGPGGDTGNRSPIVEMHEGSRPYWNTPRRFGGSVGMEDLAAAEQADRLSRGDVSASPRTAK